MARRISEKRSIREIARALGCSRRWVRQIQAGSQATPEAPRTRGDPLWMSQVNWSLTSYPNFWKQFYRKFPQYREPPLSGTLGFSAECSKLSFSITASRSITTSCVA